MNRVTLPDAQSLARMVSNVTRTMCGIEFVPAGPGDTRPPCWRMAMLPIPGRLPLDIALYSDEAGCRQLGGSMFSMAPQELDSSMVDDALREVLNMAAGQIKSQVVSDQALGLPKIVHEDELSPEQRTAMNSGVLLRSTGMVKLLLWISHGHESPQA